MWKGRKHLPEVLPLLLWVLVLAPPLLGGVASLPILGGGAASRPHYGNRCCLPIILLGWWCFPCPPFWVVCFFLTKLYTHVTMVIVYLNFYLHRGSSTTQKGERESGRSNATQQDKAAPLKRWTGRKHHPREESRTTQKKEAPTHKGRCGKHHKKEEERREAPPPNTGGRKAAPPKRRRESSTTQTEEGKQDHPQGERDTAPLPKRKERAESTSGAWRGNHHQQTEAWRKQHHPKEEETGNTTQWR